MGNCTVCDKKYHSCSCCSDDEWYSYWGVCSEECAYKCKYFEELYGNLMSIGLTKTQRSKLLLILEDEDDRKIIQTLRKIEENEENLERDLQEKVDRANKIVSEAYGVKDV